MKVMLRSFIVAVALAASAARSGGADYSVRIWQSEDGLPGNVVRSIVQSSDGFLWIACAEGIARFDGTEFVTIDPPDNLPFSRFGPDRLFATTDGSVWFSRSRVGLLRIDGDRMTRILDVDPSPNPETVTQVLSVDSRTIVARRGTEVWNVSQSPPQLIDPVPPRIEAALTKDLTFRAINGRTLPDGTAAQLVDHLDNLWTPGGDPGVAVRTPDGSPITLDFGDFDESVEVAEFLEDRENNVWAASHNGGLIRFRRLRARVIDQTDGLSDKAVTAIIGNSGGELWFGTRSSGVDRFDGSAFEHIEFSPNTSGIRRPTAALFLDRDERLWASARDGSVFTWNGKSFDVAFPRQLVISKVEAIHQTPDGAMWFGGARGLIRTEGEEILPLDPGENARLGSISCLAGDDLGRIWAGNQNGGVFRYEDGRVTPIGTDASLGNKGVSDIRSEGADRVWVTTLGSGLNFWDGSRWHRFDRDEGLPDPRLTCVVEDGRGYLWLGSLGGIFRVPKSELLARTTNPRIPLHWLRIDRADGLPTRECSGSSRPSGWQADDGKIYFATSRGAVCIDPSDIEVNLAPPRVFLRGFRANGVPLDGDDGEYVTGPGRTRLELAYHGLDFSAPEKTTYLTRLTGLDDTWSDLGTQRVTTFEAVPPGNYEFEVISINGDGIWGNPATLARIIIEPHIWQTRWFILSSLIASIAIAAGAGWVIARRRMRRRIQTLKLKQALENERARISRDLHDDLGAGLTELSILSALAVENPDDEKLRPALDVVSGKAKTMVGALDEIVWAATPSEDSLRSLVDYLSAWAREFLENVNITLRTDIVRSVPEIVIGPNRRHNIFLAAREAINNAVKHSNATVIRLRITLEEQHLVIRVIDNGKGFDLDYASSGNGLSNLRDRMAKCGGTCVFESRRGDGTTVTLSLPLPT